MNKYTDEYLEAHNVDMEHINNMKKGFVEQLINAVKNEDGQMSALISYEVLEFILPELRGYTFTVFKNPKPTLMEALALASTGINMRYIMDPNMYVVNVNLS